MGSKLLFPVKKANKIKSMQEAEYRSPTWAVLRALQPINRATRIQEEAAMSAPHLFQSAGRGDLLFWGGNEGPTVVIWESLSEQEKESSLEEASTIRVVQVKKRGGSNPLI